MQVGVGSSRVGGLTLVFSTILIIAFWCGNFSDGYLGDQVKILSGIKIVLYSGVWLASPLSGVESGINWRQVFVLLIKVYSCYFNSDRYISIFTEIFH